MSETEASNGSPDASSKRLIVPPQPSPLPLAVRWLGPVLSGVFRCVIGVRRLLYQIGLKRTKAAPMAVISVGNLTAGGTGKTPMVIYLVREMMARRMAGHPAILIRGYGSKERGTLNDEAIEMRWALPTTPVICNPDRHAGASEASKKGSDVAVLDDGFQHWQLTRLLDIVLLDATDPFGGGHLLPWGRLREPPKALRRADVVILTRTDQCDPQALDDTLIERLKQLAPYASICKARHAPVEVNLLWKEEEPRPPAFLEGKRVVAACGLGNPEAFYATLTELGAEIVAKRTYRDHHIYNRSDLADLVRLAEAEKVDAAVVSEKDAVKLADLLVPETTIPFYALGISFEVTDGGDELWTRIETVLRAATPRIQLK